MLEMGDIQAVTSKKEPFTAETTQYVSFQHVHSLLLQLAEK